MISPSRVSNLRTWSPWTRAEDERRRNPNVSMPAGSGNCARTDGNPGRDEDSLRSQAGDFWNIVWTPFWRKDKCFAADGSVLSHDFVQTNKQTNHGDSDCEKYCQVKRGIKQNYLDWRNGAKWLMQGPSSLCSGLWESQAEGVPFWIYLPLYSSFVPSELSFLCPLRAACSV